MNIDLLIIIILFITLSICSAFLYSMRKKVWIILNRNGIIIYANIFTFKNIKDIYILCKINNNIKLTERNLVRNYFLLLILSFILYIIFGILIFTSNW